MDSGKTGKDFWGSCGWNFLHSTAATYTPDNRRAYSAFLYDVIPRILPCSRCRENFKEKLKKIPPDTYLSNNHDLFYWTYVVHDLVNQATHKGPSPPYDVVKAAYFNALKSDCTDCNV